MRNVSTTGHFKMRDDRGAAAIVIALTMLLLMGMAALAVDVGAAFNERRQDQSGADVGSLAGVQFAGAGPCGGYSNPIDIAMCNGANEAIAVANATLDDPSLANWGDASRCSQPTDAAWTAKYTRTSPISDCVAFNNNLQSVWVKIPTIDVDTTFGKVIGFDSVATSAFAEAESNFAEGGGKVLPYGISDSAGGGNEVCLKTGSHPDATGVCAGPVGGNFGMLNIAWYGNENAGITGTPSDKTGAELARVSANTIIGVDHPLDEYTHPVRGSYENPPEVGEAIRYDFFWWPVFNARPNQIESRPGNTGALHDGLDEGLTVNGPLGSHTYLGRLNDPGSGIRPKSGGSEYEDTPLWSHIDGSLNAGPNLSVQIPSSCVKSGFDSGSSEWDLTTPGLEPNSSKAHLRKCFDDYRAGDGSNPYTTVLFLDTIDDYNRFAWVPELWSELDNGRKDHLIKRFRPVYLETIYLACNAKACRIEFSPGEDPICKAANGNPATCPISGGNMEIEALTAMIIQDSMLSNNIPPPGIAPGEDAQVGYALIR